MVLSAQRTSFCWVLIQNRTSAMHICQKVAKMYHINLAKFVSFIINDEVSNSRKLETLSFFLSFFLSFLSNFPQQCKARASVPKRQLYRALQKYWPLIVQGHSIVAQLRTTSHDYALKMLYLQHLGGSRCPALGLLEIGEGEPRLSLAGVGGIYQISNASYTHKANQKTYWHERSAFQTFARIKKLILQKLTGAPKNLTEWSQA